MKNWGKFEGKWSVGHQLGRTIRLPQCDGGGFLELIRALCVRRNGMVDEKTALSALGHLIVV